MSVQQDSDLARLVLRFPDETAARAHLESVRWPSGPVCPHCGAKREATALNGRAHRPGLYRCRECSKQYTVTVGTIYEGSHIPLDKWIIATELIAASMRWTTASKLSRALGVGYKSARRMVALIREYLEGRPEWRQEREGKAAALRLLVQSAVGNRVGVPTRIGPDGNSQEVEKSVRSSLFQRVRRPSGGLVKIWERVR